MNTLLAAIILYGASFFQGGGGPPPAPSGNTVRLVVGDSSSLDGVIDQPLFSALQGAGYDVSLVDDGEWQAAQPEEVAVVISPSASAAVLPSEYSNIPLGVLVMSSGAVQPLGLSSSPVGLDAKDRVSVVDTSHPVTSGLAVGDLLYSTTVSRLMYPSPSAAPAGATVLAEAGFGSTSPVLLVVEAGGQLVDGTTASGVRIVWGVLESSSLGSAGIDLFLRCVQYLATSGG